MKKERRELTERERLLRKYYLECFISEFSKVIIFFFLFLLLRMAREYIVALAALMLLRNNGGGLHFNHYSSCLIVSFAFLYASILLGQHTAPSSYFMYISILLCAPIGYYLVPITSAKRPKAKPEQIRRSKKKTVSIILLFILSVYFCPHGTYLYIIYWTIILHILQLCAAKYAERRKHHVRVGNTGI